MGFHHEGKCPATRQPDAPFRQRVPPARAFRVSHWNAAIDRHGAPFGSGRCRQGAPQHDEAADATPAVEAAQAVEVDGVHVLGQAFGAQGADGRLLADDQHIHVSIRPVALPGAKPDPGHEIAKMSCGSLLITRRGFCEGRQGFCRGGALGNLTHPDMGLARGNKRPDLHVGQIGFDQFRAQRGIEMEDRHARGPAAAQTRAPAQTQRLDRTRFGAIMEQFDARRVMTVFQRLGENEPKNGAAPRRRPWHAIRRHDLRDPGTAFRRVHAGMQPGATQAAALETGSRPALLDGEPGRCQKPLTKNARLRHMERLPELHARGHEIGGIGDVELVLAVVANG